MFHTNALALASPSGRISKRARKAVMQGIHDQLFPAGFWEERNAIPQPSHAEKLRQQAQRLTELADRGMNVKAFRKQAAALLAEADQAQP